MTRTPEYDEATAWARVEAAYEQARAHPEYYGEFADAVRRIDWDSAAVELFRQAVEMAMMLGAPKLARELVNLGLERFADDERLVRAAHVLAPPKLIRTYPAAGPELSASLDWFKEHAPKYRGQWVAVDAGKLLGAAASREELVKQVGSSFHSETIVTHIV